MIDAVDCLKKESYSVICLAFLRRVLHTVSMNRRVNRELLDKWISDHRHDGLSRLAVQSQVAADTIKKMRASGEAPKKYITCKLISDAMGVEVDELFPQEEEAS